ncbi:hypothetical protein BC937DRAFT_87029 [Endogone sp. FLAS-F59071]|nr:hypothetical protein BC937DRAFT_87029 [Endogone sp. FLAS-F59071]|eukprot:RUS19722.1 hypothetical protein BC937DRAFT_87029 [Endogone sp. FLAS-F59071]
MTSAHTTTNTVPLQELRASQDLKTRTDLLLEYVQPNRWIALHVFSVAEGATPGAFEIIMLSCYPGLKKLAATLSMNELSCVVPLTSFSALILFPYSSEASRQRFGLIQLRRPLETIIVFYARFREPITLLPPAVPNILSWAGKVVGKKIERLSRTYLYDTEMVCSLWHLPMETIFLPLSSRVASIYYPNGQDNPEVLDLKRALSGLAFRIDNDFNPETIHRAVLFESLNWLPNLSRLRRRHDVIFYVFGIDANFRISPSLNVECALPAGGVVSLTFEAAQQASLSRKLVDFTKRHQQANPAAIWKVIIHPRIIRELMKQRDSPDKTTSVNAQKGYYEIFSGLLSNEITLMDSEEECADDTYFPLDHAVYRAMLRVAALHVLNYRHFVLIDSEKNINSRGDETLEKFWAPGVEVISFQELQTEFDIPPVVMETAVQPKAMQSSGV